MSHLWNDLRTDSLTEYMLFPCANKALCLVVPTASLLLPNMLTEVKVISGHAYTVVLKIHNFCVLWWFLVVSLHTPLLQHSCLTCCSRWKKSRAGCFMPSCEAIILLNTCFCNLECMGFQGLFKKNSKWIFLYLVIEGTLFRDKFPQAQIIWQREFDQETRFICISMTHHHLKL